MTKKTISDFFNKSKKTANGYLDAVDRFILNLGDKAVNDSNQPKRKPKAPRSKTKHYYM